MAQTSSIEWTDLTWNPVTGCTKVSPGCQHCYAERMARRLHAMGHPRYERGFAPTCHEDLVDAPQRWRRRRMVFVNSMSDLFHEEVPPDFIARVFRSMNAASWHIFQILTKRSERLAQMADSLSWTPNIWMGVSIENSDYTYRMGHLRTVPAAVRFLSVEPMIGPIPQLPLLGIDWVVLGGESGPGARPMAPSWACRVRDRCVRNGVPFFFKQWGGVNKKRSGRELDGRTWDQMPTARKRRRRSRPTRVVTIG